MTDSLTVVQGREQQPSKNAQAKILLSSRCVNFAWFVIIVGKKKLVKLVLLFFDRLSEHNGCD